MKWLALLFTLFAMPSWAQDTGGIAADDQRFQTFDYSAGGIFHLPTSPGTTQVVLLAPGDQIKSVIVSDPGAYLITVAGTGDSLALRPNGLNALAMMSVKTVQRSYEFELVPGEGKFAPSVVRFSYGAPKKAPSHRPISVPNVTYHLSGSPALRPTEIGDDGAKTYISWRDDQAMPAIFAVTLSGKEEMVEGNVRDGIFTIDRVYDQLVFRIDRDIAKARRIKGRVRHGD